MRRILFTILCAAPVLAGEYAVLSNGFRLYVEGHENAGSAVRLFLNEGVIEIPASHVAWFEAEDYSTPVAPPAPAVEAESLTPQELITRAALRHGLPPELVHSIAAVESGFRTDAVSPKGAVGLMQLMPGTARDLQADPDNPEQNAEAGVRYLSELLLKYKDDPYQLRKALAGYNAGPGAVDRYNGVPPYRETQTYVEKVLRRFLKGRE
jgi:soluble lytic murein transglycosylase-like protein